MSNEQTLREYLKRVTIELGEERERLHALRHEPIAIVGMACRYPGGVASPADLWRLVAEGRDAIGELPRDRGWDLERLYRPATPTRRQVATSREGGFLARRGRVRRRLLRHLARARRWPCDPQQRLLLESAWEALEDAGARLRRDLRGSASRRLRRRRSPATTPRMAAPDEELEGYRLIGASPSVASGRIAYTLGLEGPAMTVDTACSSSLVALHLASQALRAGECSLALAGGVDRAGHAERLHRVHPPARPRPRRALQVLRRGRRRRRLGGGRRHARRSSASPTPSATATGSWP